MINNTLKKNWEQILKFNSSLNLTDKNKTPERKVRIPLTPIEIDVSLLYDLFEFLYPIFINDQQNILDLIISDDGKNVQKIYLYETKRAGIHEKYEEIPIDILKSLDSTTLDSFEEYDAIFENIRSQILKSKNVRISSLRVYKSKAIDLINQYCQKLNHFSHKEFISNLTELIGILLEESLFFIYPEPNIYTFLRDFFKFCADIKLKNAFSFLIDILPNGDFPFLLNLNDFIFILRIKKNSNSKPPVLSIGINKLRNDLSLSAEVLKIQLLKKVKEKYNASYVYYISLNDVQSFFRNLFELTIPFEADEVELLLQKLIFGIRSYQIKWFTYPQPVLYSNLIRFLLRIFTGINLNLRKLSHWNIPDLFFKFIQAQFGINSKILLLLTDSNNFKKSDRNKINLTTRKAILLEFEQKILSNLSLIDTKSLFSNNPITSLEKIRNHGSKKFGLISAIIKIDVNLFKKLITRKSSIFSKIFPFSKLRFLKDFKNPINFEVYPDTPMYRLLKDKGVFSFYRIVLPIFIDRYEF